jgi:hypothetical protein
VKKVREWFGVVWFWLKSLTPRGRARLIDAAQTQAFQAGQAHVLLYIGNLNRDQRKLFIREVVRQVKSGGSQLMTLKDEERIVVPS